MMSYSKLIPIEQVYVWPDTPMDYTLTDIAETLLETNPGYAFDGGYTNEDGEDCVLFTYID